MTHLRFEVTDTHRATDIQHELMTTPDMIEALLNQPWFIALRSLNRRWECANYNQDGDRWIDIPKGSHYAEACQKINRLFPGLLKVKEVVIQEVVANGQP
jgi:hypothetical protein